MIKGLIEQATVLKWQHLIAKSFHPNLIEAHFSPQEDNLANLTKSSTSYSSLVRADLQIQTIEQEQTASNIILV